jgi:tRNA (guanosine-2'-O-)-methyltransferase
MSQLPYKTQILRDSQITVRGVPYAPGDIVAKLEKYLTKNRMDRIEQVAKERTYSVATVVENIYDIGNISAVMRSAESFGFMPFHIIERPDAKYKMSDRISRGTEKWLDIRKHVGPEACVTALKNDGYKIYATDLDATCKIEEIDFSQKVAIVLGNEHEGISPYMKTHADGRFIIPMYGFAQSFNISVAAALTFFNAHQSRVKKLGQSGDLSPEEILNIKAHYYLRTLDSAEEILSASAARVSSLD